MNCKYDILYDNIRKRKLMWLTRPELGAYCLGITAWSCSALPYNPHTTSRIRPRAILASQDHHGTYTWPRAIPPAIMASLDHHGIDTWPRAVPPAIMASLDHHGTYTWLRVIPSAIMASQEFTCHLYLVKCRPGITGSSWHLFLATCHPTSHHGITG